MSVENPDFIVENNNNTSKPSTSYEKVYDVEDDDEKSDRLPTKNNNKEGSGSRPETPIVIYTNKTDSNPNSLNNEFKNESEYDENDENENDDDSQEISLSSDNDSDIKGDLSSYSLTHNRPLSGLKIHDDYIRGVTTTNHKPLIATVADDYRLVLYKINNEHRLQCIRRIKKKYLPLDISFDNTGECLAIAMVDGVIEVWDIKTMKPIYTLKGHTGSVLKVKWSLNDRNTLVSYSNDKTIRIWHPHSIPSNRNVDKKILPNDITDIDWQKNSTQGGILGCMDNKGTLRMFDSNKNYDLISTRNSMGNKLTFGYNNLITINGYEMNLFDVNKQERIKRIKPPKYSNNALIENVCLSYESCLNNDDSKTSFVTVDHNNLLNLWQFTDDLRNAKCHGMVKNCHNLDDKNIYSSLRINANNSQNIKINNKILPKTKAPSIPVQNGINKNEENKNDNNNNNNDNNKSDKDNDELDIDDDDDYDDEENDETSMVTNIEFCRHVPQYLLTTGKDGTIKLWDTQQIQNNIKIGSSKRVSHV